VEVVRRRVAAHNLPEATGLDHTKRRHTPGEKGRCRMFEIANSSQSAPAAEAVRRIDAHSPQYELAANGVTEVPSRPSNSSDGDFAAGLRALQSDARVRGDFATGMRSTPLLITAGDFATGLRTHRSAERVRGDFATGQHAERTAAPSRAVQPAPKGHYRRQHNTVPVTERAS